MFIPKSWICLKQYRWQTFKKDLIAGSVIGIIALPLAMAFAMASGVDPLRGLYTAIVAGFLISLLGGSRFQIGGPTGAFVVIIYGVIERHGYEGLVIATLLAGAILIISALFRLGSFIKFIPYPLIVGFTTGIAVVIFTSQIKDFLGLKVDCVPIAFIERWACYLKASPSIDPVATSLAAGTLGLILGVRRFFPQIPWAVAAIVLSTAVCAVFHLPVETIASRFGKIPRLLPSFGFPSLNVSLDSLQSLIPEAFVIAFLAGVESLLSAVVADGMTGFKHKSNCELLAQGIANIGSMCFGGIPATGAIARTAANIKTGGQTPVAGMIHALMVLLIMLVLAPLVSLIPLASLSAILMMVAWNMSELGHFKHLFKAPPGDVAVLLTAFLLTVFVDLTVAVEVGMVLAAFLFMKRMSDFSTKVQVTSFIEESDEEGSDPEAISKRTLPKGVEVYEITGPFFFGVADSLKSVLHNLEKKPHVFILRMRKVPVIDATGMHSLKEFYYKCKKDQMILLLSGVKGQPQESLKKFGLQELIGEENILPNIDTAIKRATDLVSL